VIAADLVVSQRLIPAGPAALGAGGEL